TSCDDGHACTVGDACAAGVCQSGTNVCTTQITPTNTSCSQFASGAAADLNQGEYLVKGTKINNATPGVLFYYSKIVAPSAAFTITVNESNAPLAGSCSSWAPLPPQSVGQINLYSATCGNRSSQNSYDSATGTVTMSVTGATKGEMLIVGIKYNPSALR